MGPLYHGPGRSVAPGCLILCLLCLVLLKRGQALAFRLVGQFDRPGVLLGLGGLRCVIEEGAGIAPFITDTGGLLPGVPGGGDGAGSHFGGGCGRGGFRGGGGTGAEHQGKQHYQKGLFHLLLQWVSVIVRITGLHTASQP